MDSIVAPDVKCVPPTQGYLVPRQHMDSIVAPDVKCVPPTQGYLVARQHMDSIVATAALMQDSGLPCFSRGHPIR
jgi:hypothetical protein